jgi:hypothetical protein
MNASAVGIATQSCGDVVKNHGAADIMVASLMASNNSRIACTGGVQLTFWLVR